MSLTLVKGAIWFERERCQVGVILFHGRGAWLQTVENADSTTVVSKWQEAGSLVFGSGRTGRGIGAVFASQTKAEDAPDYASRATATE